MITQQQLHTIGLSPEEATIYHALLHRGALGLQAIARATNQKRTTLYPYVQSLIERGIVSASTQGKRTVYTAMSPERLLQKLNEQRFLLEAMLPQITQLIQATGSDQSINVYATAEELKAGIEDLVVSANQTKELLSIEGDIPNMYRLGLPFWKQLLAKKNKLSIPSRSLIPDDEKSEFILHDHPIQLRVTSLLRGFSVGLYVRGDRVLLFVPSQGTGIQFINPAIASSFRLLFEGLWKKGKDANLA